MKKYGSYFVIAFILLVVVFSYIGVHWVKNEDNTKTVEEKLNAELMKNPVNYLPLSNSQSSAASQNQSAQAAQSTQNQTNAAMPSTSSKETDTKIDSSDEENSETLEGSDTKKFESANLKASFNYPEDVTVSESGNLIIITKIGISWKIRFYENKNKKDFQDWHMSHFDVKAESDCSFNEGTVKFGTYTSKSVKVGSDSAECNGEGNYAINEDNSRIARADLGKETVENANKILSSFKFIE